LKGHFSHDIASDVKLLSQAQFGHLYFQSERQDAKEGPIDPAFGLL
jgi:hypothetical protein